LRQLSTETCLDESKRRVVAPSVGPENSFVALGNDGEATVLLSVNRPLELRCPPWFEHETAGGHAAAVDVDFDDAVERPEVAKPQAIHLSGACEYVTRLAFLHATAPVRDDIDRKITDTHRPSSKRPSGRYSDCGRSPQAALRDGVYKWYHNGVNRKIPSCRVVD
jgi:hypothetical protein